MQRPRIKSYRTDGGEVGQHICAYYGTGGSPSNFHWRFHEDLTLAHWLRKAIPGINSEQNVLHRMKVPDCRLGEDIA
jgi:hypothetical protein